MIDFNFILQDILSKPLFYVTMVLAIAGAFLTSGTSQTLRGLGFFLWLFSNGFLLYDYYNLGNLPMVVTFGLYQFFNLRGIKSNWGGRINYHPFRKS